jgi:hypothetical protein
MLKTNFWLWFEIVIIFMNKTLNLQGVMTLSENHIYSKNIYIKKTCHVLGQI